MKRFWDKTFSLEKHHILTYNTYVFAEEVVFTAVN